ncbi:MAG: metallophosphoesterase [Thermomicrobiales bacterium]
MPIRTLAVSDQIDPRIYSATLRERMPDVELVFGCGDIPARYLEFLADALNKPVYFVLGNHLEELTREGWKTVEPMGCIDLGGRVVRDEWTGVILAGLPGSPRYCDSEPLQLSESQMMRMILRMTPRLLYNRLRYGRALDVLVTHAPPRDINDRTDPAHRGFQAIRRFIKWFHPPYLLHGHVHLYDRSEQYQTSLAGTSVINVYPYRVVDLELAYVRARQTAGTPAKAVTQ